MARKTERPEVEIVLHGEHPQRVRVGHRLAAVIGRDHFGGPMTAYDIAYQAEVYVRQELLRGEARVAKVRVEETDNA